MVAPPHSENYMHNGAPDCSVVLAAGKGSRMGSPDIPKVCFEIDGVPAINRALDLYNHSGIPRHLIVVGTLAGKVIETVGNVYANTAFVYQKEQLGTANALRCVFNSPGLIADDDDLLVVAGDRIIDRNTLEQLFELYRDSRADLALLSLSCRPESGQGRVVCDPNGNPVAVVEMADIRQRAAYRALRKLATSGSIPDCQGLLALLTEKFFGFNGKINPDKGMRAFGRLWERLNDDSCITEAELLELLPENKCDFAIPWSRGTLRFTPGEAAAITTGNTSVYVVKAGRLRAALGNLNRDNAQQEEYLSDLIALVAGSGGTVRMLAVDDPALVLGFNNPAELLEVENIIRNGISRNTGEIDPELFLPLAKWQRIFHDDNSRQLDELLMQIYGDVPDTRRRQCDEIRRVLACAATALPPDAPVGIVRSPGRLNVMGRHVDHQGGNCNLMTIGFETVMAVSPRDDDRVVLRHCDEERFSPCEFSIREMVASLPWEDWNSVVNSPQLASMIGEYGVDWSHYVKAAILRLQKKFPDRPLRGMNLTVGGNVPMAAGLSSSSSLVVGAAEAAVAVNSLKTSASQLVNLCGEGEWFVGTRGGAADHAAVKLGRRGGVIKVKFFDFAVEESVPFPATHSMLVFDSGIKARKSSDARDQFNHRISCYRLGFMLLKKFYPQYAGVMHYLRDVNVRTLKTPLSGIYRMLLSLPESATRDELQALLPEVDISTVCADHREPANGRYPIRGVVMFGLCEMERSRLYADALKRGDIAAIGEMMRISHDGDRVVSYDAEYRPVPYVAALDNSRLLALLDDLESGDPERVLRAQLFRQGGGYACSIPEIDLMVDTALRTPGVAGAQLAGAGLGGCMMVLVENHAIDSLIANVKQRYYDPAGLTPRVLVCSPIAGAGFLRIRADQFTGE